MSEVQQPLPTPNRLILLASRPPPPPPPNVSGHMFFEVQSPTEGLIVLRSDSDIVEFRKRHGDIKKHNFDLLLRRPTNSGNTEEKAHERDVVRRDQVIFMLHGPTGSIIPSLGCTTKRCAAQYWVANVVPNWSDMRCFNPGDWKSFFQGPVGSKLGNYTRVLPPPDAYQLLRRHPSWLVSGALSVPVDSHVPSLLITSHT